MRKKEPAEDIKKEIDNILDTYFDELANCFERKKDIQGLRGWLRIHLHEAVAKIQAVKEPRTEYMYHLVIALLVISVLNMVLIFFRYIVDPI